MIFETIADPHKTHMRKDRRRYNMRVQGRNQEHPVTTTGNREPVHSCIPPAINDLQLATTTVSARRRLALRILLESLRMP